MLVKLLTFSLFGINLSKAIDTIEIVEIDLDKLFPPVLTHSRNPQSQQYNPHPRPFNQQPIQQHQHNPQSFISQPHNLQPFYSEPSGTFHQKRSCNSFVRYKQPNYDDRPIWGTNDNVGGTFTTPTTNPVQQRNTPPPMRTTRINRQKCQEYCQSATIRGNRQRQSDEFGIAAVGGEDSALNEFQHMVAIGFRNSGRGTTSWNNCGGTLISHWYIMTAAHCTDSELGSPALVRLGALNVNRNLPGQEVEDIGVAEVIVHPDYKGTRGDQSVYHDIALLRMERRVEFREGVQPACLYDEQEVKEKEVVATGWGNLGFADAPSDVLQKVQLDIIPGAQCRDLLGTDATIPRGIQSQSQVCAGVLEGGRDTCVGDSGGPLQVNNTRTFSPGYSCGMEVIGITSFGKFCAEKNSPGVYTKVANYVPWIESIVWQNGD